ncbi:MAG: hypothetical protein ACRDHW_15990 [Ktedonobacteraceae bacterium]
MIRAQLESAEQRMQQQWHDLVMAEQAGQPLEVLEQMYDRYILCVEDFNACQQGYQRQPQNRRSKTGSASQPDKVAGSRYGQPQDAKLAS